jgi:hypothetical protein
MKTKLQRLKSCRPSPGHLEIDRWIRAQEARLGLNQSSSVGGSFPTVTVMLPSMAAVTRVVHAAADEKIAADPAYAALCARLDAELAEILAAGSARAPSLPDILTDD